VANSKLGKFLRGDFIFTLTFYVVRLLLIIVLTMILATLTTLAGLFDPHGKFVYGIINCGPGRFFVPAVLS